MGIRASAIGRVLNHSIERFVELTSEVWKGFNQNARLYNSSGEDSVPCKEDQIILIKIDGTGKYTAIGVLTESKGAKPGEKIFFARDADAKIVSKISMLNDGSIHTEADGDITYSTKGEYNIAGEKNISFAAEKDISLAAKKNVNITADENISHSAKGEYDIAGEKNISASAKEDVKLTADKNITQEAAIKNTVKGALVEVNGVTKITGGSLECNGIAPPTGTGCLCGLAYCIATGAPQTGNIAAGT